MTARRGGLFCYRHHGDVHHPSLLVPGLRLAAPPLIGAGFAFTRSLLSFLWRRAATSRRPVAALFVVVLTSLRRHFQGCRCPSRTLLIPCCTERLGAGFVIKPHSSPQYASVAIPTNRSPSRPLLSTDNECNRGGLLAAGPGHSHNSLDYCLMYGASWLLGIVWRLFLKQ